MASALDNSVAEGRTGVLTNTTAYAVLCAGTTATGAIQSVPALGAAGTVLTSNGPSALPTFQSVGGGTSLVVQRVSTLTSAEANGTTLIPIDDTIPQNTEGDQYMTLAITPLNSSHILVIDAWMDWSPSANTGNTMALYQDSTANALAATGIIGTGTVGAIGWLRWIMTAGTTSSTTFNIRAGGSASGTFTFNGASSARLYGGVSASGMMITEYTT